MDNTIEGKLKIEKEILELTLAIRKLETERDKLILELQEFSNMSE